MNPIDPKLVRDGIPDKIRRAEGNCRYHVAVPRDHLRLLGEKLLEEVEELLAVLADPDAAEAESADVFEVLDALLIELGVGRDAAQARAPRRKPLTNKAKEILPALLLESADSLSAALTVKAPADAALGDVIRDVEELIQAFGFSRARVVNLQRQKRERVGGFTQWIVLEAC